MFSVGVGICSSETSEQWRESSDCDSCCVTSLGYVFAEPEQTTLTQQAQFRLCGRFTQPFRKLTHCGASPSPLKQFPNASRANGSAAVVRSASRRNRRKTAGKALHTAMHNTRTTSWPHLHTEVFAGHRIRVPRSGARVSWDKLRMWLASSFRLAKTAVRWRGSLRRGRGASGC